MIKKNIAAIFRETNLLEYKSPNDYISVADFYRVYSYACLLVSIEKTSVSCITISFVESRYSRELFAHLRKIRGYIVEETCPGIYNIKGDIFPIQVINNRRLSDDENLWLKGLSDRLNALECLRVHTEIYRQNKAEYAGAFLNAIARANAQAVKEAIIMSKSTLTLEQVLEESGLKATWEAKNEARIEAEVEARVEAKVEERKAIQVAQNMINLGLPFETIVSATSLDPEKVKTLYQN